MEKNTLFKYLTFIFLIIILCAIFIRTLGGTETLQEYAEKNPEIAYQEKEPSPIQENTINTDSPSSEKGLLPEASTETDTITSNGEIENTHAELEDSPTTTAEASSKNQKESEEDKMTEYPDRVIYKEGFYYEPLTEEIKKRITGISYPVTKDKQHTTAGKATNIVNTEDEIQISYDDLRYVSILHYNFKGIVRTGELICNKAIAQDMVEIFYELYQNQYQIEQIHLVDEYGGDDTLSMQDNNTSCFNYRVVDGTSNLSKHALGLAIDINPFFNPYVVYKADGSTYISPSGSETYADRSKDFAYKIDENDLCYKLFIEHGFIWGGHWNSMKDYQHFQKVPE